MGVDLKPESKVEGGLKVESSKELHACMQELGLISVKKKKKPSEARGQGLKQRAKAALVPLAPPSCPPKLQELIRALHCKGIALQAPSIVAPGRGQQIPAGPAQTTSTARAQVPEDAPHASEQSHGPQATARHGSRTRGPDEDKVAEERDLAGLIILPATREACWVAGPLPPESARGVATLSRRRRSSSFRCEERARNSLDRLAERRGQAELAQAQ